MDKFGPVVTNCKQKMIKKKNKRATKKNKWLTKHCALVSYFLFSCSEISLFLSPCFLPPPVFALMPAFVPALVLTISPAPNFYPGSLAILSSYHIPAPDFCPGSPNVLSFCYLPAFIFCLDFHAILASCRVAAFVFCLKSSDILLSCYLPAHIFPLGSFIVCHLVVCLLLFLVLNPLLFYRLIICQFWLHLQFFFCLVILLFFIVELQLFCCCFLCLINLSFLDLYLSKYLNNICQINLGHVYELDLENLFVYSQFSVCTIWTIRTACTI